MFGFKIRIPYVKEAVEYGRTDIKYDKKKREINPNEVGIIHLPK